MDEGFLPPERRTERFLKGKLPRALDQIDRWGERGWRDHEGEGRVRYILLGLRVDGLLERDDLLEEMRSRGYDEDDLTVLNKLINKTYAHDLGTPRYPPAAAG